MIDDSHKGVERVIGGDDVLGIIIRRNFSIKGTSFLTPTDSPQQVAVMSFPANEVINPHIHNEALRTISRTQELLIIAEGKLRVDFYDLEKNYIESHIVSAGDVLFLVQGGHGFVFLEDVRMIEVKNGPYLGESDRTRFNAIDSNQLKIV